MADQAEKLRELVGGNAARSAKEPGGATTGNASMTASAVVGLWLS